jgi:hypothetical protein
VDLVLAESSALSLCLATEPVVEQLARVLRPGGRMLLVVESLMLGLARLAEQGRWAELADAPSATWCWSRTPTAASPAASGRRSWRRCSSGGARGRVGATPVGAQRRDGRARLQQGGDVALRRMVKTELALAVERQGESTGLYLHASARRP